MTHKGPDTAIKDLPTRGAGPYFCFMSSSDEAQPTPEPAMTPFAEHRVESAKPKAAASPAVGAKKSSVATLAKVPEIGGPPGPEPTRYGDWQFNGKVTDF
jgi:hypothetical protein